MLPTYLGPPSRGCAPCSRLRYVFRAPQKTASGKPAGNKKAGKITKKVRLGYTGWMALGNVYPGAVRLTDEQFVINASQPASDKIFDVSAFEKFLHDRIKVDGRTNNLGETIKISQQGEGKIEVIAHQEFSGRYLKYL